MRVKDGRKVRGYSLPDQLMKKDSGDLNKWKVGNRSCDELW